MLFHKNKTEVEVSSVLKEQADFLKEQKKAQILEKVKQNYYLQVICFWRMQEKNH